jgi:hypothetical protein
MRKSGSWRVGRWAIALGSMAVVMATAPSANAAITSVFSNTPAPIPCAVQGSGVRLCDQTIAGNPGGTSRSTVPSFDGVPIDAAWGGPINVSGFTMPVFGPIGRGNVHYGLGYTGNGVGPTHLAGKILAALALHAEDGFTRLAVVTRTPKRFPPEPFRSPGAFVVNAAIRRKDDREDAGHRVGALTGAIARLPRRLGYNLGPR